jgi:predicted metal-dependent hydrolase
VDRRANEGTLLIELGGRPVEYRFARRRRRTLGITVDTGGLRVAAPMRASWRDIEAFLRAKERWILAKLDKWSQVPRPRLLAGASGESLPYLGVEHQLDVREGRSAISLAGATIIVSAPRSRVLPALLAWLKAKALETLAPRVGRYAAALALPAPRVALTFGRRQWGTCSAAGTIRLNWRLVHVAPELADYVAAHEVAHLVEMNHSKRFWALLAALYPAWRVARERLELASATLPIIRRTP